MAVVGLALALRRGESRRFAAGMAVLAGCGVVMPLVLSPAGLDYVSSRNVVAALVPVTLLLGYGFANGRAGRVALAGLLVISVGTVIGVALGPQYGRRDWRGASEALGYAASERLLVFSPAFSNPGPFRVYFGGGSRLVKGGPLRAREVAVVALAQDEQFGPGASEPPVAPAPGPPPGFSLTEDRRTQTYRLVRFRSARTRTVALPDLLSLTLPGTRAVLVEQYGHR